MATDSTILQILNALGSPNLMVPTIPAPGQNAPYQMDMWAFSSVPPMNFQNFPVKFFTGDSDQDDQASCSFKIGTVADAIRILAASNPAKGSQHTLQVEKAYGTSSSLGATVALGVCPNNTIINALAPNDITWVGLDGLGQYWKSMLLPMNGTFMGVAVVDVSVLGLDAPVAASIMTAISGGTLTYIQAKQLQSAIVTTVLGTT